MRGRASERQGKRRWGVMRKRGQRGKEKGRKERRRKGGVRKGKKENERELRIWINGNSNCSTGRFENGTISLEDRWQFLKKIKNRITI